MLKTERHHWGEKLLIPDPRKPFPATRKVRSIELAANQAGEDPSRVSSSDSESARAAAVAAAITQGALAEEEEGHGDDRDSAAAAGSGRANLPSTSASALPITLSVEMHYTAVRLFCPLCQLMFK